MLPKHLLSSSSKGASVSLAILHQLLATEMMSHEALVQLMCDNCVSGVNTIYKRHKNTFLKSQNKHKRSRCEHIPLQESE